MNIGRIIQRFYESRFRVERRPCEPRSSWLEYRTVSTFDEALQTLKSISGSYHADTETFRILDTLTGDIFPIEFL